MSESLHRPEAPPAIEIYPDNLDAWLASDPVAADRPLPARVASGEGPVGVDWYQLLASGFAGGTAAVTPAEREALVAALRGRVEALGAAACLGPFAAEEEAAGALLVALLQFAAARGFSLRAATDRALVELAIGERLRGGVKA